MRKPKRGHGPTAQVKLPTREVHHRLAADERECPACQGTLEEMGEQTEDAEEITVEKRRFFVDKHLRHKYRCGRCSSVVKTAPGPLILGLSIAVDATCKLPIVFCAGVVRDYEASLVVTVNNVVTESSPLRATVRQLNDHPQCTHLQTND